MKIYQFQLGFLLLLSTPNSLWAQSWEADLEKLYHENPGLITQLNPEVLKQKATLGLKNKDRAEKISQALEDDLDKFMKVREGIISKFKIAPPKNLKPVVISGQSVTGMVAAAIAAQSGHEVRVYDSRMRFTRDIQWSSRQSVADILASIDPKLAENFTEKVARNLEGGYVEVSPEGNVEKTDPSALKKADPRRIPQSANAMFDGHSVATVQTRVFEELLYEYLKNHPNVTQKKGKIEFGGIDPKTGEHLVTEYEDVTPKDQKEKVFKKLTEGHPITIVAEGASSSSRAALGISSVPTSPKRLQVAGVIGKEQGGEITTHYRDENIGRMVTGSMGTTGSQKRWLVGDIAEENITPDPSKFGSDPSTPEYSQEKARLLEIEFKKLAAQNMRLPVAEVNLHKASGAIDGAPLQTFELQQRISNKAASGSNVLLLADAVGNAHWSVGGGMHVGVVNHGERIKDYLSAVDGGEAPILAARRYSENALSDSKVWGERGLNYFYNNLSYEESSAAYKEATKLYFEGKVETPEKALNLMLPAGISSRGVKNIRLECQDIIKHVLGEI